MDIRVRKLKVDDASPGLSRSLPTSRTFPVTNKTNCFKRCLNSSTDSLNSTTSGSPKLGQYRKIPNRSECDMCHEVLKVVHHLKCFHSVCQRCADRLNIETTGCPSCAGGNDMKKSSDDLNMFGNLDFDKDVENIDQMINRLETEILPSLSDKQNRLKEEQVQIDVDAKEQIDKINEHVKEVKQLIDDKAAKLIKTVQDNQVRYKHELDHRDNVIHDFARQIQESVLNFKRYKEVGEQNDRLNQQCEDSVRLLAKISEQIVAEDVHIRHIVKPTTDSAIDALIGRVVTRVFLPYQLHSNLLHTHTFPVAVQAICPIDTDHAWVAYKNHLQLCSKRGIPSQKIDISEQISDLCLDEKGDLLIACENSVKILRHNIAQTLFTCTDQVQGISCQKDGGIIVCVNNKVLVYNKQGEQISEMRCSPDELKMPYKVATNINGFVYVTDCKSTNGEVAVFREDGVLLARMRTEGVAPRGIACSNQGLVYVCDFRSDRIHIYSTYGHFLQTIVTSSQGLSGPSCVALDHSGDLWIGDWKRRIRIFSLGVNTERFTSPPKLSPTKHSPTTLSPSTLSSSSPSLLKLSPSSHSPLKISPPSHSASKFSPLKHSPLKH